jgi:hypothetical protein
MTIPEADAAVDAAYEAVRAAQDALTVTRIHQWRAHADAWLEGLRARLPCPPGSVEVIDTRNVSGIGAMPHTRWIETIEQWEGQPWRSKPRIVRNGREARWSSDPAQAYAVARDVWSSEPHISPNAAYRGAWADWSAFCTRHGQQATL